MKTSVFMEILWGTLKHYIFEEVASADESNYMLMERKERTFLALYGSLGKDEQTAADNRMDFLLSQTRALLHITLSNYSKSTFGSGFL